MLRQATLENSWGPSWSLLTQSLEVLAKGRKVRMGIIWSIVSAMGSYPCACCWITSMFGHNDAPQNLLCLLCMHATTFAIRTAASWRAAQEMPEVDHPLMAVSGRIPATIKLDLLHLVDLGVASHLYGNLVWDLVEDHAEGGSRVMKLHPMNKQIVEAYKTCGISASQRLKRLNLSDVCAGGDEYPILKHCKGRRIRHFSKVTVKL